MYSNEQRFKKRGPQATLRAKQGSSTTVLSAHHANWRGTRRRDGRSGGVTLFAAASVLSLGVVSSCAGASTTGPSEHVTPQIQEARAQMMAQLDAQQRNLDALRARLLAGDGERASAHPDASEPVGTHLPTAPATVAPVPAGDGGGPPLTPPTDGRLSNTSAVTHSDEGGSSAPTMVTAQTTASPAAPATTLTASPVVRDAAPAAATAVPSGTGNAAPAARQDAPAVVAPPLTLTTSTQRQAYASGVTVWRQIAASLDAQKAVGIALDPQLVLAGLQDMANGRSLLMSREAIDAVMTTLNQQFQEHNAAARAQTESEGRAYRIAFSREKGAKSDAGAWYQVLEAGTGKRLRASDVVELSVTGSLPDGSTFDPSGQNGQTKTAKVSALLPAVAIGLQKVSVGGHIKVVVPPDKGYGEQGLPPSIPGGATLIFDIRVLRLAK